jgi:beta-lactamase class A
MNVDRYEGQLLLDMAGVVDAPPRDQWTIELQRKLVADVPREALNQGRVQYLSDERDTTTPSETAQLLGRLQLGNLLPPKETGLLLNLMMATRTGPRRLKAHLPDDAILAHKTGTTAVVINDVGLITLPPGSRIGGRIALAVYVADGTGLRAMERTVAQLGAAAFEFFSGRQVQPTPLQKKTPARRAGR